MERVPREYNPTKAQAIVPTCDSFHYSQTPIKSFCADGEAHDQDSDIQNVYISLALRYFLSHTDLLHNINQDHIKVQETILEATTNFQNKIDFLFSGSSFEQLTVPYHTHRRQAMSQSVIPEYLGPDVDMMIVLKPMKVGDVGGGYDLELDYSGSHPGFAKIQIHGLKSAGPYDVKTVVEDGKTKNYLHRGQVVSILSDKFAEGCENLDKDDEVEEHGPAITRKERWTLDNIPWAMTKETDLVFTIVCPKWPTTAIEWLERERMYAWPSEELIRNIVANGCHMVAIDHAESIHKGYEWRLSFSAGEKVLAKSLSIEQRKCYVLFKLLQKCHLSTPKVLCSYHLKNILLWTCEGTEPEMWTEPNTFSLLLLLWDKLCHCLEQHNIPNFFIPSNNMISHIGYENVKEIHEKALRIRQNIYLALIECDQQLKFDFSPSDTLQELFDPFILTLQDPHADAECMKMTLAFSLIRMGQDYLSEGIGYHARAYAAFADAWAILLHSGFGNADHCITDEKILFILVAALGGRDIDQVAAFYDYALMQLEDESKERDINIPAMVVDSRFTLEMLLRFYQSGLCRYSDTLKGIPPAVYAMSPEELQKFIVAAMMSPEAVHTDGVDAMRKSVHGHIQLQIVTGNFNSTMYFIPAYNLANMLYVRGFYGDSLRILQTLVWACDFQPHLPITLNLSALNRKFIPPQIKCLLDLNSALPVSAKAFLFYMLFQCYIGFKRNGYEKKMVPSMEDQDQSQIAKPEARGTRTVNVGHGNSDRAVQINEAAPFQNNEINNQDKKKIKDAIDENLSPIEDICIGTTDQLQHPVEQTHEDEGDRHPRISSSTDEASKDALEEEINFEKAEKVNPPNRGWLSTKLSALRYRMGRCRCPLLSLWRFLFPSTRSASPEIPHANGNISPGDQTALQNEESLDTIKSEQPDISKFDVNSMLIEFVAVCQTIDPLARACSMYLLARTFFNLQKNNISFTYEAEPHQLLAIAEECMKECDTPVDLPSFLE